MGVTKARQERNKMALLKIEASILPDRMPSINSNKFWTQIISKPIKIAAPMVRHTDLPCRMQLRSHGAELCYTSMIDSDKFIAAAASSSEKQSLMFSTCSTDRPLIVQFGATNVDDFINASKLIENQADAVCLNMDCPQRRAKCQGFGAFLMKDNKSEVLKIISKATKELSIPIVCKIRLLSNEPSVGNGGLSIPLVSDTIEFCKEMEKAGVQMIVIHGRTIDMKSHRSLHPVDYVAINAIRNHLYIPVIANGDIQSMKELYTCLDVTQADGVMVASELMCNPHLFDMSSPNLSIRHRPTPIEQLRFTAEYLYYCSIYNGFTSETLKSHIIDTIIVPIIKPISCRTMIPFGDGVETLYDAEVRVCEVAIVLSILFDGKNNEEEEEEEEKEKDTGLSIINNIDFVLDTLKKAKLCFRWMVGIVGENILGGKSLEEKISYVKVLFLKGRELMNEYDKGYIIPTFNPFSTMDCNNVKKKEEKKKKRKQSKKRKLSSSTLLSNDNHSPALAYSHHNNDNKISMNIVTSSESIKKKKIKKIEVEVEEADDNHISSKFLLKVTRKILRRTDGQNMKLKKLASVLVEKIFGGVRKTKEIKKKLKAALLIASNKKMTLNGKMVALNP